MFRGIRDMARDRWLASFEGGRDSSDGDSGVQVAPGKQRGVSQHGAVCSVELSGDIRLGGAREAADGGHWPHRTDSMTVIPSRRK